MPKFSIIIPVVQINDYIHESIRHILNLDYQDFEVLIFPDKKTKVKFPKTKIIPTGKISPAEKRNLALKEAHGEILTFLDDDAYPKRNWLSQALKNFQNPKIAASGGPAITPPQDNLRQKASGASLASFLGSGKNRDRYLPGKIRKLVYDWPSVNLFIRKKFFKKLGGFNSNYWPGEDTKLCFDIIKRGGKILYDPQVLVYHHRRKSFLKHLAQIGSYGLHRGFFAKKFPENSRKFTYFIPSLFVIFIILSILIIYFLPYSLLYYFCISIFLLYGIGLLWTAGETTIREKNPLVGILVIPYIFSTHIVYGIRFLQGLFTSDLKSKLRE